MLQKRNPLFELTMTGSAIISKFGASLADYVMIGLVIVITYNKKITYLLFLEMADEINEPQRMKNECKLISYY